MVLDQALASCVAGVADCEDTRVFPDWGMVLVLAGLAAALAVFVIAVAGIVRRGRRR